jgi:glutaredoxin
MKVKMEPLYLFIDSGCPHCRTIKDYLDKRDAKPIKEKIKFVREHHTEMRKQHNIDTVPALVLPDGRKLVGNEVFDWLRSELINIGVDPDSVMTELPTGFWEGNQKFVFAVFLLAGVVKYLLC